MKPLNLYVQVDPDGAHSKAIEARPTSGASSQGSPMRGALRMSGMMEGQVPAFLTSTVHSYETLNLKCIRFLRGPALL